MTTSNKLRISDLEFDSIKFGLVDFLRTRPEFTDYDFSASGLSTIIDLLAYNSHYQALMANFVANEMYIDTAVKRSSVVSLAKSFGYTPRSINSATASINLTVSNVSGNPSSLVLPAGTRFSTIVNTKNKIFSTISAISTNNSSNQYVFSNVPLYEGEYVTNTITWNGVDPTITIPNGNVDTNTLRVFVTENGSDIEYVKNTNFLDIGSTTKCFFLQEGFDGFEIYFGDGNFGAIPDATVQNPATIKMKYIVSSGSEGNSATVFSLASSLGAGTENSSTLITTISSATGGKDAESIDSIKLQALNHFGAQNRAVIADDYTTIIKNLNINTDAVLVWGGEDNDPPKYNTVFVCIKPAIGDAITSGDMAAITTALQSKAVANIKFDFINPEYIDLIVSCAVNYNQNLLTKSTYELEALVKETILSFAASNLVSFDSVFRTSNLTSKIDLTDESILSNSITTKLMKSFVIEFNRAYEISAQFNNVLSTSQIEATVKSSQFYTNEFTSAVWMEDDKKGIINILSTINGVISIVKYNVGTVNYNTGDVYINPMVYTNLEGSQLKLYAQPADIDIYSKRNSIIRLTSNNVSVSSMAK
jgi:hypothetical protein